MKKNYIYNHIRKISLINLIIPVILSILIAVLFFRIPFSDVLSPRDMSSADLADEFYLSNSRIVELSSEKIYYTGYNQMKNNKIKGYYYYSLEHGVCTFILIDSKRISKPKEIIKNYSLKASIDKQDAMLTKMIKDFSKDLNWTNDGLLSVSSSYYINETGFNENLYLYLGLCLFFMIIILLSYIIINITYIIFPRLCPACANFSKISNGIKEIANVNSELKYSVCLRAGHIIITNNYIVSTNITNLMIIPIRSIDKINLRSLFAPTFFNSKRKILNMNFICINKVRFSLNYITIEYANAIQDYLKSYAPEIKIKRH